MKESTIGQLESLPKGHGLYTPEVLRVCTRTVMDNTDPDITFDQEGICNWWHDFQALVGSRPTAERRAEELADAVRKIKEDGEGKPFDCVLGLSGGADSSFMAFKSKEWGLRPLIVHFDNGWNDELAVRNIEVMIKKLNFRLHTYVMDWPEFRDLQRAYFKASVLDLEVPTDHMIFGALHRVARQYGIKWILSGNNYETEWVLPKAWYYPKGDLQNIRGIHRAFGELPLRKLPRLGVWQKLCYERVRQIQQVQVLELIPYKKLAAKQFLMDEFGWKDYGGKHYESVFTRFYQSYILPTKYGIDKRKAHLSNLILNGEITREQALAELSDPPDDPERQRADKRYVAKKLGWSEAEFERIIALPPRSHEEFGTDTLHAGIAKTIIKYGQPFAKLGRAFLRV